MAGVFENGCDAVSPEKVTSRVTGLVTPLSVRSPVTVADRSPLGSTDVEVNVIAGNCFASRRFVLLARSSPHEVNFVPLWLAT
jgi:hypothetical protein